MVGQPGVRYAAYGIPGTRTRLGGAYECPLGDRGGSDGTAMAKKCDQYMHGGTNDATTIQQSAMHQYTQLASVPFVVQS